MPTQKKNNKLARFFKYLYLKLFRIHDSPQKIALGFGLGVFAGIVPGTGPAASLALAFLFKVNRASALLGSILTNTWLSIVTFALSIKVGSAIMNLNWEEVKGSWLEFIRQPRWNELFSASVAKIVLPVALGYLMIALCSAIIAYSTALLILSMRKK